MQDMTTTPSPAHPPQLVATLAHGVLTADTPVVLADDLGLTRGDGVFDATRVRHEADGSSRVDHLDRHVERFARSIALLDGTPPDLRRWLDLIDDAVAAWQVPGESVLKIMWTRGLESSPTNPTGVLTITPLAESQIRQRAGISVAALTRGTASGAFTDRPWLLGGAKTLSYGVNVAAKREATRRGADDVLFTTSDGYALEGPTSALVAAFGRRLVTTPVGGTGILASITQQVVFEAAAAEGWQTASELMRPEQLSDADGAWLLSSVRGSAPILRIDDVDLPHDDALSAQISAWAGF